MTFTGTGSAGHYRGEIASAAPVTRLNGNQSSPFFTVRQLGAKARGRGAIALSAAVCLHFLGMAHHFTQQYELNQFARYVQNRVQSSQAITIEVEMEQAPAEPVPPPPPEVEDPLPPPKAKPPVIRQRKPTRTRRRTAAPPPKPAQAGRVLTAKSEPTEPLDLTGNTFIQGTANSYAGGVTTSRGTSSTAVRNRSASDDGQLGGTGTDPAANLASTARPLQRQWNCPFPAAADLNQINYMQVPITVLVNKAGRASTVRAVKDPGHGFGRAAVRCAKKKRYAPARNRAGSPVPSTLVFTVTFRR